MGQWSFSPDYRFVLKQRGGKTWSLTSLQSCQAMLATTGGVGQLSAVFHDPSDFIKRTVQPHSMDLIQLWLRNRYGQWGKAWTGYIDTSHRAFDPEGGNTVQLTATSPYKLFEKVSQTPAQAARLAVATATNLVGSAILKLACDAVGYPWSMVRVHPVADVGSGYGAIDMSVFTNPNAATWSTPIQALLTNTGLELFCDEAAHLYYRQFNFVNPWMPGRPAIPRVVSDDDLLHADLFESDQGAVTRIEVRYLGNPVYQNAPFWQAPPAMEAHLRPRHIVVNRPDITQRPAAQYLADTLGLQYTAGVLQGTVTIPADPLFGIGTLCRVPSLVDGTQGALGLNLDAQSLYYISSATYTLDWGGTWAMTLGLSAGRGHDQTFPYVGDVAFPLPSKAQRLGLATTTTIPTFTTDPHNNAQLTHPFTIVAQPSRAIDQVAADPTVIAEGTVIMVKTALKDGSIIGGTINGEYAVVKGAGISGYTLGLKTTTRTTGYVTIITDGSSAPQVSGASPAPSLRGGNTGNPPDPLGTIGSPRPGASLPLRALNVSLRCQGPGPLYVARAAGPDHWDCSGLVAWAYNEMGVPDMMVGSHADVGPNNEYDYFVRRGAVRIDPSNAQPGDLLFIVEPNPNVADWVRSQRGFSHIAFCYGLDLNFGANNDKPVKGGIYISKTSTFRGFFGTPFTDALDLSRYKP